MAFEIDFPAIQAEVARLRDAGPDVVCPSGAYGRSRGRCISRLMTFAYTYDTWSDHWQFGFNKDLKGGWMERWGTRFGTFTWEADTDYPTFHLDVDADDDQPSGFMRLQERMRAGIIRFELEVRLRPAFTLQAQRYMDLLETSSWSPPSRGWSKARFDAEMQLVCQLEEKLTPADWAWIDYVLAQEAKNGKCD